MSQIDCVAVIPHQRALLWLGPRLGAGLTLAIVADPLFLDAPAPGLALAVFLSLLAAVAFVLNDVRATAGQARLAIAILLAGLVALLAEAKALNYGLALLATSLFALSMTQGGALRLTALASRAALRLGAGPLVLIGDLRRVRRLTRFEQRLFTLANLLSWIVPLGALIVFSALLANGNPLLERWFGALLDSRVSNGGWVRHVVFGAVVLALVWSLIHVRRGKRESRSAAPAFAGLGDGGALLGAAAMTRALVLLNALFGLQSAADIAFLWGGLALPQGMTPAEYAHRGAYPLVLTALLAGAFVLVAMRPNGPAAKSQLIRPLVFAWIAQNILLVMSSMLRLKLYVAVFSLTELRVAAFIWMMLVAVGLALIVAQIVLRKTNGWLLEANARALALAVFGAALMNSPALIGSYNLAHCREAGGEGPSFDYSYLFTLGPQALPSLDAFFPMASPAARGNLSVYRILAEQQVSLDGDWRAWSYRSWRLKTYLANTPDPSQVN